MIGAIKRLVVLCIVLANAAPVRAQLYNAPVISGGNIGRVLAAGQAQTIFRVDAASGNVTKMSGSAERLSSGTANVVVTITCGSPSVCVNDRPIVTIASSGAGTGRAAGLTNFTVSPGTATFFSAPTGTNPVTFTLDPIGRRASDTFFLGFDLPINASGTTGNATSGFSVTITRANGNGPSTGFGTATASVFRGITLTKTSDLVFGRIIRPTSGAGTVVVSPGSARVLTGAGSFALATPTPTAAAVSISGEGGQSVTVTVPSSFVLSNGTSAISVTTSATGSGAQALSGTLGSAGSLAVAVGGGFSITAATPTGVYTGNFVISVQYN